MNPSETYPTYELTAEDGTKVLVKAPDVDEMKKVQETQTYKGFSLEEIEKAFSAIQNEENWKKAIDAWIPAAIFGLCAAAVEFYTGSELRVVGGPQPLTGRILVHADGYYAVCGA